MPFAATPMDELPPDLADEVGLEEEDSAKRLAFAGQPFEAAVDFSAIHSLLITAAIWGVLCREGLIALGSYAGLSVFPTLLAQVVGCWVMGLANQQKENLSNLFVRPLPETRRLTERIGTARCSRSSRPASAARSRRSAPGCSKSSRPLQTRPPFVATAFTTSVLLCLSVPLSSEPDEHFGQAVDGISQTVATMGMSAASITFGYQCGALLLPRPDRVRPSSGSSSDEKPQRPPGDLALPAKVLIAIIGPALWVGAAILVAVGPHRWRGKVTWSLVFGPVGVLLRFHLARLNASLASERHGFPLGTFAANILGTVVYALCAMLQVSGSAAGNVLACGVLQGIRDGFSGCLTTVSTFAFELRNLAPNRAWRYALVSWATGQIACVLLYGAYEWARGSKGQCALQ